MCLWAKLHSGILHTTWPLGVRAKLQLEGQTQRPYVHNGVLRDNVDPSIAWRGHVPKCLYNGFSLQTLVHSMISTHRIIQSAIKSALVLADTCSLQ